MKMKSVLKVALVLVAICSLFVACDTLAGGIFPVMYESEPGKLYLLPSGDWAKGDEKYACWFWADGGSGSFVDMVAKESDPYTEGIYEVTVPEGVNNVIFVRLDKTKDTSWDAKWDQTVDLKIPTDGKVLFDTASMKMIASASADNIGDAEEEEEEEEVAKTVNDLTCFAGTMNGWNPADPLVNGSFTFSAKGGDQFKFTAGGWNLFDAGGVKVSALDSELELSTGAKDIGNITFADDVLTVDAQYKVTLIIRDGKAFVKVEKVETTDTPTQKPSEEQKPS